jgi:hypothetical protein
MNFIDHNHNMTTNNIMWAICQKRAQLLTSLFDSPNILFASDFPQTTSCFPSTASSLEKHLQYFKQLFYLTGSKRLWNSYVLNYSQVGCWNEVYIIKRLTCSLNRFHVCILLFGKLFGTAWDWLSNRIAKMFHNVGPPTPGIWPLWASTTFKIVCKFVFQSSPIMNMNY